MGEGDGELVRGRGQGEVVALLQLLLVVMLLQRDHLVTAEAGQSPAQETVRVLLVNLLEDNFMMLDHSIECEFEITL